MSHMELEESVQRAYSHLLLQHQSKRGMVETATSRVALFRLVLLDLRGQYDRALMELSVNDFAGISQLKKKHRDYCSSMLSLYPIILKETSKDRDTLAYQKYYTEVVAALIRAFGPILYAKGAADCPLTQLLTQLMDTSGVYASMEQQVPFCHNDASQPHVPVCIRRQLLIV